MFKQLLMITAVVCTATRANSAIDKPSHDDLKIVAEKYQVELLDPNASDAKATGARFVRAGWLKSLKTNDSKQSLIVTKSVFSYHTAYGLTTAFEPAIKIRDIDERYSELLVVGVGTVKRDKTRGFAYDQIIKPFPWRWKIMKSPEATQVIYTQDSGKPVNGYAWIFSMTVTFNEDNIIYEQSLLNTGSKPLDIETFVHPFFNAVKGKAKCKFILPHLGDKKEVHQTPITVGDIKPLYIVNQPDIPAGHQWVAGLNIADNNQYLVISTSQKLYKTQFWRNKEGCFAVEPFIKMAIPPGRQHSWNWTIDFGQGRIPRKFTKRK
jgi:hypothetical protein